MPRPAALPPQLGREFTVASALGDGVTAGRLRRSDLHRPFRGARSTVPQRDLPGLAVALGPLLGPGQRFSHLTAAELWGMRLPEGHSDSRLHVTSLKAARAMRRPGVVGHTEAAVVAEVQTTPSGVPASSPVDAWCESAALLTVDDLVVMGDGLVSRRHPAADLAQLTEAIAARSGRRGTARLRVALRHIRANSDSARETMLRLAVTRAGFPEPAVNAPLRDAAGRVIAHGDLVWSEFRVVLEYEAVTTLRILPSSRSTSDDWTESRRSATASSGWTGSSWPHATCSSGRSRSPSSPAVGDRPDRAVAFCRPSQPAAAVGDASATHANGG